MREAQPPQGRRDRRNMRDEPTREQSGEDRITAVPRGPGSAFVHWHLNGPRSAEVARELGPDLSWVLRVLDVSDGTSSSIPVDVRVGNCYVDLIAGQIYGFELGARSADRWRTVCRTGRVQMPPLRPSGVPRSTRAQESPGADRPGDATMRRPTPVGAGVPGLSYESTPPPTGASFPSGTAKD